MTRSVQRKTAAETCLVLAESLLVLALLYGGIIALAWIDPPHGAPLSALSRIGFGILVFTAGSVGLGRRHHVNLKDAMSASSPVVLFLASMMGVILVVCSLVIWIRFKLPPNRSWNEFAIVTSQLGWLMYPVWLVHSFGEELFFRGFFHRYLNRNYGFVAALLGSSCFFSLAHVPDSISSFFMIFTIGLVLGSTYERFQSLWPGVLLHTMNNYLSQQFLASRPGDWIRGNDETLLGIAAAIVAIFVLRPDWIKVPGDSVGKAAGSR